MSKKVRIHDLAKMYGMQGKDLAARLRDLGFGQVKSHMSALDEFEVLQARGILEANGLKPVEVEGGESPSGGSDGLLLKKKKKKKKAPTPPAPPEESPADEVLEPAPVEEPEEAPVEPAAETPSLEPAVEPEVQPDSEPTEGTSEESEPIPAAAQAPVEEAPAPAVDEVVVPEPASAASEEVPPVVESPTDPPPPIESETPPATVPGEEVGAAPTDPASPASKVEASPVAPAEPVASEAPAAAAAEATSEVKGEATGAEATAESDATDAKEEGTAAAAGPRGTVVGFIDPKSFQRPETKGRRTESRRLRSSDDEAPDVQPTFMHDRTKALMRGAGGARGELTAAQLRERESGRFLRRRAGGTGPGQAGGRGGGGRRPSRGPGRREDVTQSPLRGSTATVLAPINVQKLAETLKLKSNVLIKAAMMEQYGLFTLTTPLDEDQARLLADLFEVTLQIEHEVTAEQAHLEEMQQRRTEIGEEQLEIRPPTVAFLGHVDHGKTTLIDKIRATRIAEHEAGGITQHIGAYQVETQLGHTITILDTPGHAAFTAMRARGASAVDIVVLVVAGDDGVKPHTEEAIAHARAAGTPIVIAITKSDKPEYNPQRVLEQLTAHDIVPEDWGGQTGVINVSGITGDGIEDLLERVFAEGELLELKAHPEGPAAGVVLEAEIQQGKGIVAHLLIQDGTLKRGDVILAGEGYGKVKAIHNDRGEQMETGGPSTPVEVTGLSALPDVGDAFHIVESLAKAKEVAEERERNSRQIAFAAGRQTSPELQAILGDGSTPEQTVINLIVRADVQGSVGAIKHSLADLKHEEIQVKVLHAGVGAITESDVDLAATSGATLIAFHVGVGGKARVAAERAGVEIRRFEVIYELIDYVRDLMEGSLAPELKEEVTGHVEIRRIFKSSKLGSIAGCYVLDGIVARDSKVRLLRDDKVIHSGRIGSLKRESDDAREVREGFECGILLKDYRDVREGDIIETFRQVEVKRTLDGVR